MDIQEQNWNNFCRYHALGDWHGKWTRYSSQREVIETFKCVRCFNLSEDGQTIHHQNFYTYADGKTEVKTFKSYTKPITSVLFLDNSFTWGSTRVKTDTPFSFETGFRYNKRGATAMVMYDLTGKIQQITISSECLGDFDEKFVDVRLDRITNGWTEATTKSMTPDLMTTQLENTHWIQLENLSENNDTFHSLDGISVSFPRQVKNSQKMLLAVDYLVNPNLLQRGIRHFDLSGFTNFTLQTFTPTK